MQQFLMIIIFSVAVSQTGLSQNYFICYKNDKNPVMQISICFNETTTKAKYIKYKGKDETITLFFYKEKNVTGGTYPTINDFYYEKIKGKITGTYKLTHSGVWDYVVYTRKKDGRKFNFTIDHEASIINEVYRKTPCF